MKLLLGIYTEKRNILAQVTGADPGFFAGGLKDAVMNGYSWVGRGEGVSPSQLEEGSVEWAS